MPNIPERITASAGQKCIGCHSTIDLSEDYSCYRNNGFLCEHCTTANGVHFNCHICQTRSYAGSGGVVCGPSGLYHICHRCNNSSAILRAFGYIFTCANCNHRMQSGGHDCHECRPSRNNLCDRCMASHSHRDDRRSSFSNDIFLSKKTSKDTALGGEPGGIVKIDRLCGVEIEAIDGNGKESLSRYEYLERRKALYQSIPTGCGIARDGSVSGPNSTGFEVITQPASLDLLETIIKSSCEALRENGFSINKTCGLHVHLDARDFMSDGKKLARVMRTFYAVEDLIFSLLPPSRWDNHYCQSLSKNYCFDDFKESFSVEDFEQAWYAIGDYRFSIGDDDIDRFKGSKYNHSKYSGINFHATMYRGTIEFRHHAGSLNAFKILHWINLLQRILKYALERYNDSEVVELFSMETGFAKLDRFCEVFKIPKRTKNYMTGRIDKWNSKFLLFRTKMSERSGRMKEKISALIKKREEREKRMRFSRGSLTYWGSTDITTRTTINPRANHLTEAQWGEILQNSSNALVSDEGQDSGPVF